MLYPLSDICAVLGILPPTEYTDVLISDISIDTRSIMDGTGTLFVALSSQHRSGTSYLMDAYRKGVRVAIVDRPAGDLPPDMAVLVVAESLLALQSIARAYRAQHTLDTIAVTGSNGKTIVKEWLYTLLHRHRPTVKSPKSYNSQIGVALSLFLLEQHHEIGIFEAGISKTDEMPHLAAMIQPSLGIFTNIGDAHSSGFIDESQKISEKARLFTSCETIIYCADHLSIHNCLTRQYPDKKLIGWSSHTGRYIVQTSIAGEVTVIQDGHLVGSFATPLDTPAMLQNLSHCLVAALHLGIPAAQLSATIEEIQPIAMRLERASGIGQCILINDTYNADLASLQIALDYQQSLSAIHQPTLILSDLHSSHDDQHLWIASVQELVRKHGIRRLITVGSLSAHIEGPQRMHYTSTGDLLVGLSTLSFDRECILIKGSRSYHLEDVYHRLLAQSHTATMTIDLGAVSHNLDVYRSICPADTAMMVIVKASAYGSGSAEVARLLEQRGVAYLAVAFADEGIYLRREGITLPILVLNPDLARLQDHVDYDLDLEIYTPEQWPAINNYGLLHPTHRLQVHLKIDTGMHRLGFLRSDWEAAAHMLDTNNNIELVSVFSHLAASDDPEMDDFTQGQIDLFATARDLLPPARYYHILNTAGIARHTGPTGNMVRLGLGLYGIDNTDLLRNQLEYAHRLTAKIIQVKTVAKGGTVGYGRSYIAQDDITIAIVNIGYADGLMRRSEHNGYHFIHRGETIPIVGKVCMDLTICKIGHSLGVDVGDEVIIFGPELPIHQLAQASDSIAYEVLSRISPRVQRRYIW